MGACCGVSEELSQSEKNQIIKLVEQYGRSNQADNPDYQDVRVALNQCYTPFFTKIPLK